MPRRIADYRASDGRTTANLISTIGAYVTGLSVLVFLVNVGVSWVRRRPAGDDPWEGQTSLKWATSSPPPRFNFERPLPPVRSPEPLLDLRGVPQASKRSRPRSGACSSRSSRASCCSSPTC